MKEIGFSILRSLTFIIPQLIILSACIYYLIKKTTLDGILLILGSLVGLAVTIFQIIVLPYLYQKNIVDPITGGINAPTTGSTQPSYTAGIDPYDHYYETNNFIKNNEV